MTRRARILIVDDDAGMIRAVERVLGRRHEVTTAAAPRAALDRIESFDPDLAILDIRMPVMDGFELAKRLVAARPGLDVIFMTGSVTDADAHLVRAIREGAFYFIQKPFEREVLQTLVERCLELRALRDEKQRHVARLERELAEARRFQRSLLPPGQAELAGVRISARYEACAELGGDLYDYAPAGEGRVAVLVADVSGHGASAAMMTGIVKSAFQAAQKDDYEPMAVLRRVVESIGSFEPDRFVTLLCARVETDGPRLEYVNAGHPPAFVWAPGGTPNALPPTGPLISSGFVDVAWSADTVSLASGERLLLYTDGIIEARSSDGSFFGSQRVVETVTRSRARGLGLLDELLGAVGEFVGNRPHVDDLTVLAAEINP